MIVYATKLTIRKAAIGLAVLGGILWGITALAPKAAQAVVAQLDSTSISQKLKDNAARVEYLHGFGWTVDETPVVEMEVQIPKEFDSAYQSYNAIQLQQGLDLTRYCGKRAMLYTYKVTDYPTKEADVTASLLLYKNRVIAADISSSNAEGFTHGLTEHPAADQTAQPSQAAQPNAQQTPKSSAPSTQQSPKATAAETPKAAEKQKSAVETPKSGAEQTPQPSAESEPEE